MVSVTGSDVRVFDGSEITVESLASRAASIHAGWGARDADAMMERHLLAYPVRDSWASAFDELERVHSQRVALWGSIGAREGMLLRDEVVLPRELVDSINGGALRTMSHYFSLQMTRDNRRKYLSGGSGCWRLSFRPGAIIGAAQRYDYTNLMSCACACFGYEQQYEGTAGQMVFDPQLAVLERVNEDGERVTGFQFVVLTETGIHAYGGCYIGYDVDSRAASALALKLSNFLLGNCGCDYATENNSALADLCEYIAATTGSCFNLKTMEASSRPVGSEVRGVALSYEDAIQSEFDTCARWSHIENVANAYGETTYKGGFWCTGVPAVPFVRLLGSEVSALLEAVGVCEDGYRCEHCGCWVSEDEAYCGDDWGLSCDSVYCSCDCVAEAQRDAADSILDGIALIDGELYRMADRW